MIKPTYSSDESFLFNCFPVYDPQKLSQGHEGFSCSFRWLEMAKLLLLIEV